MFRSCWLLLCLSLLGATWGQAAPQSTDLVLIPAGVVHLGDVHGEEDERPLRQQAVPAFRLARTEVTNAAFAAFVAATGHLTDAEKEGWGWVWDGEWRQVQGANWRHPSGPATSLVERATHPVVQVSWEDAQAYCRWQGQRLPRDAEWEYAARGQDQRHYPWGDVLPRDAGQQRANYGTDACCAPDAQDGYLATAPVGSYPIGASPFGILDMAGNVWEWIMETHPTMPELKTIRGGGWGNNPYCLRTSYRHANPPTARLDMVGFRCAADAMQHSDKGTP